MATDLVVGKPCSLPTFDLAGGEVRWPASWEVAWCGDSPGLVSGACLSRCLSNLSGNNIPLTLGQLAVTPQLIVVLSLVDEELTLAVLSPEFPLCQSDPSPSARLLFSHWRRVF